MGQRSLLFAGLGLVVVLATGCGSDVEGLCEAQEACIGGNDADIDACIASYEGQRDTAYGIGCGEEFDTLVHCTKPLLSCSIQPTGEPCNSNADCSGDDLCSNGQCMGESYGIPASQVDTCAVEQTAYSRCD
ncbi:hypothetical protein [Polyangium jinanense]|uniref:Lipoprotein n=1 Tax=Polyangium jinanense TaxID=2829994 RepID=A0A9X3XCA7_9BACT|nr:hypothetical protein [Polyangium jinanense]MDC3961845.1 hypothetical protein [Polyangium jinanense]MDC3987837.1 hypothetical protein [Polyangium jinanense]